jgi:DNA-binding FadR family transcriptional regulator
MDLPRRRNLSQVIASEILDRIRRGEIGVGDRLPTEAGLMQEYGVGRNAVREAIQQLVAVGVLDVRPGRGTTVLGRDTEDLLDARTVSALLEDQTVKDLYSFRMLVEVEIAAEAARRATEREIAVIAEAFDEYRRSLEAGRPVYRSDVAFHRTIAIASMNSIFVLVLDALADLLEASRSQAALVPGASDDALRDHAAILAAIQAHDPDRAREAMTSHIRLATEVISHARSRRRAAAAETAPPG